MKNLKKRTRNELKQVSGGKLKDGEIECRCNGIFVGCANTVQDCLLMCSK